MKIYRNKEDALVALQTRYLSETKDVLQTVEKILLQVKQEKDDAVRMYTEKFDGVKLEQFQVTEEEIATAYQQVPQKLLQVIQKAKENIIAFHEKQKQNGYLLTQENGAVLGQRVIPLDRVGVYVPGGTAAYPSTVLMDVLPAQIAGVSEIVMITPPNKHGEVNPAILVTADLVGVKQIYKVGGAHGVAALAYGTETIPKVDKIVGPGNIYVATAKRLVYGQVDIDMIAGPSDVLIVADETANAKFLAADLLAQAEHDSLAQAILITTHEALLDAVQVEVEKQLNQLERIAIARESLENKGKLILVETMTEALELVNEIAPEHLELAVTEPFSLLGKVKHAGSVFLGHYTPEVLGDYFAGPNHTLPTEGTARFYSALSVEDFVKKSSYLYYPKSATQAVIDEVILFAESEGLGGHANSMRVRKGDVSCDS